MLWLALIAGIALAMVYVLIVRPILKTQPMLAPAFAAEATFLQKARAKLTGFKTLIAAWLTVISGVVVELYDQALPLISGQDWTPLTAKLPSWALPVGMVCIGLLFGYLRKLTENPPQVIIQKVDGIAQVVDVHPPAKG
ncbi:hypothetical protein [Bradyrhizobium sp. USDA 4452]